MCFNSETQWLKIPIYPQGKYYFAFGTINIFVVTLQHTSSFTHRRSGKVTVSPGTRRDDEQRWQVMPNIIWIPRGGANEVPLGHGKWAETRRPSPNVVEVHIPWRWRPHFSYRWCGTALLFVLNGLPHRLDGSPLALFEKVWIIISYASFSHLFWQWRLLSHFSHFSVKNPHKFCMSSLMASVHWENITAVLMGFCTGGLEFGIDCFLLPSLSPSSNYYFSLQTGASWLQSKAVLSLLGSPTEAQPMCCKLFHLNNQRQRVGKGKQ